MYFKRLEMHGFKSFAEPVVIEFHEGVTCIVGPNGSGKSNISDAIRWVLGEQSPKALRGGKMEEVIFAGTAHRKSRGMAEVTLVIDNTSGILDIDYNEVAITRRMYRSGESEYMINNNQCRLKDIRELIMDTGIGVDGYSIIGQGKIADIVSNKPESRREIFEEAAGVVLYKSKKAEAERKLDGTKNNLDRVEDIIGEIEDRIDGLKEDSEKAQEYLKLRDKYKELEINITLRNIENANKRNEVYNNDVSQLVLQLQKENEDKKNIDEEVDSSREKSETLDRLGNEARDKNLQLVESINQLQNKSQLDQERLSVIERDKERLAGEITDIEEKLNKESGSHKDLENSKDEIGKEYDKATLALQDSIDLYNNVSDKLNELNGTIDSGKNSMYALHGKQTNNRSEVKSIESLKQTLESRKNQLLQEGKDNEENNQTLEQRKVESEKTQLSLEKSLKEITEKITSLQQEESKLILSQKELNARGEQLRIEGSQKSSRKKTIEEMESNYEGYNYAVRFLMRKNIPGIRGVVADLIEVPSGLEIAIETALGAAMQNLVCDSDNDAKNAIDILKQNNGGRATFLPIESIRGHKSQISNNISQASGYKGLACDCLKYDSKYSEVISYLLGRVAIVDKMDTAIALSKKAGAGLRFVTLEGEIINASGAITGGKYKNKTANLLERKGEINQLDREIEDIRRKIVDLSETTKSNESNRMQISVDITKLEESKHEQEIHLATLTRELTTLKDSLSDFDTNKSKFDRELQDIAKEVADADNMIAKLDKENSELEKQLKEISHKVEKAMDKLEETTDEVEAANEDITNIRITVNGFTSKKENLEQLIARIKEAEADYIFQRDTKKREITSLEEEKDNILFGSGDNGHAIKEMIEEKKSLEEYIENIDLEKQTLSQRLHSIIEQQKNGSETVNSLQDQKYQLELKIGKNDNQLDTLKEKLWEEYEISYAQALDMRKDDFVMSTSVKESKEIRERIRELGDVNVGAIKEFESVDKRYKFLTEQKSDITAAMDQLQEIIDEMENTIKTRFKDNFDQVVINFENIFRDLFGGGHAELRMEDENDPLTSGIDIIAQPPGKKLQNINLMSGGEKTMTAIALMFAVLKTKPTPFCILDEVEAALDDNNIDRFATYLRKFQDIQFALVTHQKATMEHADVLYGVTMPEQGISKVLSLRLGDDFEL